MFFLRRPWLSWEYVAYGKVSNLNLKMQSKPILHLISLTSSTFIRKADLQKVAIGANAICLLPAWTQQNQGDVFYVRRFQEIFGFFLLCGNLAVKVTTKQKKAFTSFPHKILVCESFLTVQKFSAKITTYRWYLIIYIFNGLLLW